MKLPNMHYLGISKKKKKKKKEGKGMEKSIY